MNPIDQKIKEYIERAKELCPVEEDCIEPKHLIEIAKMIQKEELSYLNSIVRYEEKN